MEEAAELPQSPFKMRGQIMKKTVKWISLVLCLVFLLAGSVCYASAAGSIRILDEFQYLHKGAYLRLNCHNTSQNTVRWSSSNPAAAVVDEDGTVQCVGSGTVTITADIGHQQSGITFQVGDYKNIFRTACQEVTVNAGSLSYIELQGTKSDCYDISSVGNSVSAGFAQTGFYDSSILLSAQEKGVSYVTVFNSSGYGYTMKVNVAGARDAAEVSGVQYDAEGSRRLFDEINSYRKSLGLTPCTYSETAESTALAQIITAHRLHLKDKRYDYTLHNISQLSVYELHSEDYQGRFPVEELLEDWKLSSGHNRELTKPDYNLMGTAVCRTNYGTCAFLFIGTEQKLENLVSGDLSSDGASLPLFAGKPAKQTISAKDIVKTYGNKPFSIHAKAAVPLTYRSSNERVVTVAKNTGLARIRGCGKVSVTISGKNLKTKKITITVKPKKQTLKLQKSGSRSLKAVWRKDTKASGYQLVYSAKPDFSNKKTVTSKSAKTGSKTLRKLKGRKYYVKVRSYRNGSLGGKRYTVYGFYSAVRSLRIR